MSDALTHTLHRAAEDAERRASARRRDRELALREAGATYLSPEVYEVPGGDLGAIGWNAPYLIHESKAPTSSAVGIVARLDAELHSRLARYGAGRARAERMGCWLRGYAGWLDRHDATDYAELVAVLAAKLEACGSYLVFREYLTLEETRLHAAHFCHEFRLCPLCAIRRAAKMLQRYESRVLELMRAGGLTAWLVTLTVKSGPDLAERLDHLRASLKRLHKDRSRARGSGSRNATSSMLDVEAAAWSFEVKRGRGRHGWHPHVHAVWLASEPPQQWELSAEWHKITGDSYIVDVRRMRTGDASTPARAEQLGGDLAEVFKYALKFSELRLSDNYRAQLVTKGRRLLGSLGELRGLEVPADLLDAKVVREDLPYIERLAWYMGAGVYTTGGGE